MIPINGPLCGVSRYSLLFLYFKFYFRRSSSSTSHTEAADKHNTTSLSKKSSDIRPILPAVVSSEVWNGYIGLSHAELYVKAHMLYGKNDKLYADIKSDFLNKSLTKLRQKKPAYKPDGSEIADKIFRNKNIFEYLESIRRVNEMCFIRFEPCESKIHRSTLNLSGRVIPHDTTDLYAMTFSNCSTQSSRHNNYLKLQIPSEHTTNFESFYLFALKKKEDNVYDRFFLDKFSIRLERNRDLIMGVIIKKSLSKQILDFNPLDSSNKRKIYPGESFLTANSPDETSSDSKKARTVSDSSQPSGNTLVTSPNTTVLAEQNLSPPTRDPRLFKHFLKETSSSL